MNVTKGTITSGHYMLDVDKQHIVFDNHLVGVYVKASEYGQDDGKPVHTPKGKENARWVVIDCRGYRFRADDMFDILHHFSRYATSVWRDYTSKQLAQIVKRTLIVKDKNRPMERWGDK